MSENKSSALTTIAPVVLSLVIGGIAGYLYPHASSASAAPARAAGGGGGGRGGGMGGGGGGMGMMGGGGGGRGGQAGGGAALPRLVRNLGLIEKVQNKGLTTQQTAQLMPILQQIQSADKLPESESTAKETAIEAILTADQKQALQDLQPGRPGGGGGGGMGMMGSMGRPGGGPGGPGGGMGGGGMRGGGGGMGGGGGQDPDRPFASARNKQALQDLIASLQGSGKH